MNLLAEAPSILDTNGPEARHVAGVWWLMFGLAAAVYVIVAGMILFAVVRGRRTATGRASRISDDAFVWAGGVVVPVVILMVLAGVTVATTKELRSEEKGALRVDVVGKRWWWEVRYPDAGVTTANEIHVPAGRPIVVRLDSDNVVHSFWVPQLAGKVDMVPGQRNVLRLKAERPGTYRGECAEFCGIQHARMDFLVVAEPPATFERWLARRQRDPVPSSEAAAQGERVFMREACAGCHTVRGTEAQGTIGPDLSDMGARRWLGAITVPNTRGALAGWIANSQTTKPGNLMPPISLSPGDLNAIVAYLEGLT